MLRTPLSSDVEEFISLYSIGKVSLETKLFRLMHMEKDNNQEVSLIGFEYNATIYGDADFVRPTSNYSLLDLSVPSVSNIVVTERLVKRLDGTIEAAIDVVWLIPVAKSGYIKSYAKARVFVLDNVIFNSDESELSNTLDNWVLRGETSIVSEVGDKEILPVVSIATIQ